MGHTVPVRQSCCGRGKQVTELISTVITSNDKHESSTVFVAMVKNVVKRKNYTALSCIGMPFIGDLGEMHKWSGSW